MTVAAERRGRSTGIGMQSDLSWFALRVKSRHEKLVSRVLSRKGLDQFLPVDQTPEFYLSLSPKIVGLLDQYSAGTALRRVNLFPFRLSPQEPAVIPPAEANRNRIEV